MLSSYLFFPIFEDEFWTLSIITHVPRPQTWDPMDLYKNYTVITWENARVIFWLQISDEIHGFQCKSFSVDVVSLWSKQFQLIVSIYNKIYVFWSDISSLRHCYLLILSC